MKDLAPISAGMAQAIVLVIHPSLPVKNVKELIALAKARPGQLNYGAGTVGATPHLAMERPRTRSSRSSNRTFRKARRRSWSTAAT